ARAVAPLLQRLRLGVHAEPVHADRARPFGEHRGAGAGDRHPPHGRGRAGGRHPQRPLPGGAHRELRRRPGADCRADGPRAGRRLAPPPRRPGPRRAGPGLRVLLLAQHDDGHERRAAGARRHRFRPERRRALARHGERHADRRRADLAQPRPRPGRRRPCSARRDHARLVLDPRRHHRAGAGAQPAGIIPQPQAGSLTLGYSTFRSFFTRFTPSTLLATAVAFVRSAFVFTVTVRYTTPYSVLTTLFIILSEGSL